MKEVLAYIEKKKQEFMKLPLFEYMRDTTIDARQRLAWAPCAAPFIMSFGHLNKYVFRQEPTTDPIQAIINKHTYEDDRHWLWFLEDIKTLGFDRSLNFTDALRFLWSEQTKNSQLISYQLSQYALNANPITKLIVIEVTEATGNTMFSIAAKVGEELKVNHSKKCLYFADFHLDVETGHTTGTLGIENLIESIKLTDENRLEAIELVDKIFKLFEDLTNELLSYAKNNRIEKALLSI
ncbi:hypothetical protein Riv7116_6446 [Rivularia sp. PCC 7116]|uniref:hypothetical protein n=1 Tax=Rivularia sp. PCC 7116 TaxID=373994 RepID=UPI00029F26F2|nr:hypothetical protein [Rivularia sp. PCC 7116]AFY58776.1 hypothetical protein Riv7116_6446 [Rivularia sp. PCC 7116]